MDRARRSISERFWARRFQRDPAAVGRALIIGGHSYPIVGVMPGAFTSAATDVWLPSQTNAWLLRLRDARFVSGIGRLRPGVSAEAGGRELATIQQRWPGSFPRRMPGGLRRCARSKSRGSPTRGEG